ncbi:MAG TPA: c-type cytochrome biogenesis protein CcsB [Actinomycetes bacterium]|nr:c-type cytochrome biogenesis protein CcsB [Actinomycetes bacterium]
MVVYTGAMYCYAAELAFGNRSARRVAATERELAAVGAPAAGAPAGLPTADSSAASSYGDEASAPQPLPLGHRMGRIAVSLTVLAFLLHLAAVVTRGASAGRMPWGNMFEFATAAALAVTGVFLVLLARKPVRYLGLFVVGPVLLMLGLAVTVLYTESEQLVPALKSVWLGIHVTAAIVAMGLFTVGFSQTILYLIQARRERVPAAERTPNFMDHFPAAAVLDRAAYRMHAFVFPLWTFAIVAGAIWAENAWGRYWGWDPKEVWSFITWVAYAAYLHARATAGWRGHKAAYVALLAYGTILFNYLVVNIWLVGFHSYSGV